MIFKQLTIQNFLSIRNITLNLENQGLVLLKGQNLDNESLNNNGAGKSSIIEAMVYALYGRTLRGLKGDAVVHRIPGKNTKIWLDLVDDDGTEYRIARYRKHSTNKNKSFLYRNKKDITPKSEAEFNDCVANLLQADYLTFTSSLLYSAESFKFTSATDAQIKNTFDIMLGLDVYQRCQEIAKNKLKSIESELSSVQWKIDDRKAKIAHLEEQIQEAENEKVEYENSVKAKQEKLEEQSVELSEQLDREQDELNELKQELDSVKAKKEKIEQKLSEQRKKLKQVEELKQELQNTKDAVQEQEREIRKYKRIISENTDSVESYSQRIIRAQKKITDLKTKQELLNNNIGQPCPTCGQPMTEESIEPAKKEYEQQIQSQQEEIIKYQRKVENINSEILTAKGNIETCQQEINELQETIEEFESLIKKSKKLIDKKLEYEEQVQEVQEEFYRIESSVKVKVNSIKQTQNSLERIKRDIIELPAVNPYESMIDKYKSEQDKYKSEIEDYESSVKEQIEEKECLEFWQKAYSNQGIKSFILDDITPFLNRRVNKYLSKLASGHIEVKFTTQTTLKSGETREKFGIEITNQDGGQEYSANSGGERKRIDLAINLALQDLVASRSNKRINISIWDEVFDSLDQCGIESVIELLQELSKEKSSIFVISHNEHLQSYFTNVLTVVKKDGYSTILNSN